MEEKKTKQELIYWIFFSILFAWLRKEFFHNHWFTWANCQRQMVCLAATVVAELLWGL